MHNEKNKKDLFFLTLSDIVKSHDTSQEMVRFILQNIDVEHGSGIADRAETIIWELNDTFNDLYKVFAPKGVTSKNDTGKVYCPNYPDFTDSGIEFCSDVNSDLSKADFFIKLPGVATLYFEAYAKPCSAQELTDIWVNANVCNTVPDDSNLYTLNAKVANVFKDKLDNCTGIFNHDLPNYYSIKYTLAPDYCVTITVDLDKE
jgi:hypothetical protein